MSLYHPVGLVVKTHMKEQWMSNVIKESIDKIQQVHKPFKIVCKCVCAYVHFSN